MQSVRGKTSTVTGYANEITRNDGPETNEDMAYRVEYNPSRQYHDGRYGRLRHEEEKLSGIKFRQASTPGGGHATCYINIALLATNMQIHTMIVELHGICHQQGTREDINIFLEFFW